MSKADEAKAREQRLAAKLRENLKRRKQAAREDAPGRPPDAAPGKNPGDDSGKS